MGVTVIVNSMTVSHKGSSGMSIAFPDLCKTPILGVPVPIPYPNIAMSSDLTKGTKKVKCDKKKVLTKASKIKRSMGDEPGVQKGVISNKQMGKGKFANYSFDVKFEGKNVCRLLDPTTQNRSSMNAAAFAHIQEGGGVAAGTAKHIEDACTAIETKNAIEKMAPSEAAGPETSGITKLHWNKMVDYMTNEANPKFLIYFRGSGEYVGKWIKRHESEKHCHEPKPHEWMDGLSCKPARQKDQPIEEWAMATYNLRGQQKEHLQMMAEGALRIGPTPADPVEVLWKYLYGVIISNRAAYGIGRPILGRKVWNPTKLNFRDKLMTGDYDMMDIIMEKEVCQRPNGSQYGKLKMELNYAMGWPGIQHPPQATYNTESEGDEFKGLDREGKGHFSNAAIISSWLQAGVMTPYARNATTKQRVIYSDNKDEQRELKMIDDKLTILGPDGGLYLHSNEDYWDALVCCGCLEVKPDTENLEESEVFKQNLELDEAGGGTWKGEGHERE